jgi:WD40 repeat protein
LGVSGDIEQLLIVHDIDPLSDVDRTLSADALSPTNIHIDEGITFAEMVFTRDGSLLVAAAGNGDVMFFDATTWELAEPIAAHDGSTLDVAVNEAGTLIASAGDDGFVRVWNLSDRLLVTEIRFDVKEIANVEFIDDTHLFVTPGFGNEAIVITLDSDELLAIAQSRLIRSFTQDECATYGIDPCPTPATIKGE